MVVKARTTKKEKVFFGGRQFDVRSRLLVGALEEQPPPPALAPPPLLPTLSGHLRLPSKTPPSPLLVPKYPIKTLKGCLNANLIVWITLLAASCKNFTTSSCEQHLTGFLVTVHRISGKPNENHRTCCKDTENFTGCSCDTSTGRFVKRITGKHIECSQEIL